MKHNILLFLLLASSPVLAAEDNSVSYLSPELNEQLQGPQCTVEHTSPLLNKVAEGAYYASLCSHIARDDHQYKRSWELYSMVVQLVTATVSCDCPLHVHADRLYYAVYEEMKKMLDKNELVKPQLVQFCEVFNPK